ncbi:MAG: hypothetical protein K0S08_1859 [Gammaproteobacteria bacterium]|jgi:hypothetical protein|nr:hypothetical protein [Gammaproteobacteria bacterium]
MKLLCFLVLLLSWRLPIVNPWLNRFALLPQYVGLVDKALYQRAWYMRNTGFIFVALSFAIIFNLLALVCGFGVVGFIFQSCVLLLCVHALNNFEFGVLNISYIPNHLDKVSLNQLSANVWQANYRLVAPVFWYLIFGVFGLTLYTMLAYLQQNSRWQNEARSWLEVLAWIPARILAFAYAVAGNFSQGLKVIGEFIGVGTRYNQYILQCCAMASVMQRGEDGVVANIQRLVRDALVLLTVLYLLLALLGWLIV